MKKRKLWECPVDRVAVGDTFAVMAELDAPKVIDLDGFPVRCREADQGTFPKHRRYSLDRVEVLLLMRIAPLMGLKSGLVPSRYPRASGRGP